MKKAMPIITSLLLLCLVLTGCDKAPEVFSVNNFSMLHDSSRARIGVTAILLPNISGYWTGMEHNIDINITNGMNGLDLYSVTLIDTAASRDSGSTSFDINFMATGGKPYAEVYSWNSWKAHEFNTLTITTYLKINKLTADTIIVQMMDSHFTKSWLKVKGYRFFTPADEKAGEDHTVYLTENLPRLATLLKELYRFPKAFQMADTIVRRVVKETD